MYSLSRQCLHPIANITVERSIQIRVDPVIRDTFFGLMFTLYLLQITYSNRDPNLISRCTLSGKEM